MIHGERIVLRAVEREDLPNYVQWLNDPQVVEFFGQQVPLSMAQEKKRYEQTLEDRSIRAFSIDLEGHQIGGARFSRIDGRNLSAEISLFIGLPELWDQGLGSDVLQTLLRFGFEQMNLHRVYLHVYAENERARRLCEKAGFRPEGRWRQAEFRRGRYHDLLWMSLLRDEWTG